MWQVDNDSDRDVPSHTFSSSPWHLRQTISSVCFASVLARPAGHLTGSSMRTPSEVIYRALRWCFSAVTASAWETMRAFRVYRLTGPTHAGSKARTQADRNMKWATRNHTRHGE